MGREWIAHLRLGGDGAEEIQTVDAHCANTARYARDCLAAVGLGTAAYLAGLHHDDGKRSTAFQDYIQASFRGEAAQRGSVIHTFTGARLFLERGCRESASLFERLTAELIACGIGSHHGLFDCVDPEGNSGLRRRMDWEDPAYSEAVHNLRQAKGEAIREADFLQAVEEVKAAVEKMKELVVREDPTELSFYFGLLARLLTSAVVEGDRRDTGEFMHHIQYPTFPKDMRPVWGGRLDFMERKLRELPNGQPIFQARSRISQICLEAAQGEGGVFQLNVPTGAGKTLSALRFALAHAQKRNCARIIFTTPLLSILEQNAAVLRAYIGDDSLILEHHSNVTKEETAGEKLDERELLEESWSSPVIITTLVQLLNCLFSGKMAAVRRFHSLCGSVIVMDEIQEVPLKMVGLFNLAVNFLVKVCNATVVLCSATQPCFREAVRPIRVSIQNMVPPEQTLWEPFQRTVLTGSGSLRLEEIPALAEKVMESAQSLLIVCNKKDEAREIYRALQTGPWPCRHLSAAMCPAHRRAVLAQIREKLDGIREKRERGKLICVSTQVIEAGVDISFGCVIRFVAGMDSGVQAAGRCNRERESQSPQPVYLVNCVDEKLSKLPEIQRAKTASLELLEIFNAKPEAYDGDLSGEKAMTEYYRLLYRSLPMGYQDDTVGKRSLYTLLANHCVPRDQKDHVFVLRQAFKTAGQLFRVFDEDTVSVLVPYDNGETAIGLLHSERARYDLEYVKRVLEEAKPYFISMYSYQIRALQKRNGLHSDPWGRVLYLDPAFYDKETGFSIEDPQNQFLEV